MTRVFLDRAQLRGEVATITGADAHHLLHVLRLQVGDSFVAVAEDGREYTAQIVKTERGGLQARLGTPRQRDTEAHMRLTIYHGLPRLPRYETALRMCTELGVTSFVPMLTRRSVIKLSADERARKAARWRRIVEAAARQCGRVCIPAVSEPLDFEQALEHFQQTGLPGAMPAAALAGAQTLSLGEWASARDPAQGMAVFIGPESGFDLREEAMAAQAGIALVTMGPRILRTETAAVAAATICLQVAGQLR